MSSSLSGPTGILLILSVLRLLPAVIVVVASFLYLTKFSGAAAGLMVGGSLVSVFVQFGSIAALFARPVLHMSSRDLLGIQSLLQLAGLLGASLFAIGLFLAVVNRVETAR